MKRTIIKTVALLTFVLIASVTVFAQTKPACQAYFQVVQMDRRIPSGIVTGMNPEQKKWWEKKGQKKYPELCWNGSILAADKPRYLLIWSSETPGGPVRIPKDSAAEQTTGADAYGTTVSAMKEAASTDSHPLLKRTILVVDVSSPGEPPIELIKDWWFFRSYSQRVLDEALRFLVAAPPSPHSTSGMTLRNPHRAS
jgi:hypothetical protein